MTRPPGVQFSNFYRAIVKLVMISPVPAWPDRRRFCYGLARFCDHQPTGARIMADRPTVARTVPSLRRALAPFRDTGERIALVPTMGALHRGHLALVREARRRARHVVVSIFVNPTQFAPHEDFGSYPRGFAADLKALQTAKADLVWAPSAE